MSSLTHALNDKNTVIHCAKKIFGPKAHAGHIKGLADALCEITGISVEDDLCRWKSVSLETGVAISPVQAAKCLLEVLRSQRFMQGVAQAVSDKLKVHGQVNILYAGTGPYGLLLLPYLAAFPHPNIQVTLLDIHAENIDAVNQLINVLCLREMVQGVFQADATEWQPAQGERFDLIISETMNTLLRREPQVWIFSHLQQFLKPDGQLIPEKIQLRAWLANSADEKPQQYSPSTTEPFYLGDLFLLNRETAKRLNEGDYSQLCGELKLPNPCPPHSCVKFTTDIQIYGNYGLAENQSSLNMPIYKRDVTFLPDEKITFSYRQIPFPEFVFEYPKVQCDNTLPEFGEVGDLGIFQLKRIWKKSQLARRNKLDVALQQKEWPLDTMIYDELGLGLEPAIQALYQSSTFTDFERWILNMNEGQIAPSVVTRLNKNITASFKGNRTAIQPAMAKVYPLSAEHWDFWQEKGYLVLPNVIDRELCEVACAAVFEFLKMDALNPDTWYQQNEFQQQIMVQLFRHPALNKIRESGAIQSIYQQLWQSQNLCMSTDRVSFNPPERPGWQFPGPHLHWDAELKAPLGFNTQGLVYLTDTTVDQGAFTCVPGFHKKMDHWLQQLPPGTDPQQQNWQQWDTQPIAAKAGSLIVWHHALPHGSRPNKATSPRIVQYVNMHPIFTTKN